MIALGLDVGGTSVKAAVLADGAIVATGRSAMYHRPDRGALADAIESAFIALGTPVVDVAAVGLCVPGLFDRTACAVTFSVNVPGLVGLRLDDLVGEVLGRRAANLSVVSDARAAAHDVWQTQNLSGRLLAISIGTGVGACVLDDGRPLHVSGESPGHLGQMDVSSGTDQPPPLGPDGGLGSLEAYIGLPALMARYGDDLERSLNTLGPGDEPLRALARGIRIAHAIYRPDHIALLGGVGIRLRGALGALRELVQNGLTQVARPGWTLRVGESDFHAACGAARLGATGP